MLRKLAIKQAARVKDDSRALSGFWFSALAALVPLGSYFFILLPGEYLVESGIALATGVFLLVSAFLKLERAGFVELLKERDK